MPREKISAFVICCNEEQHIRRCLDSIKWCDEIVIIDSGSIDQTLTICREYTTSIVHRDWSGFVDQKHFGLEQCSCPWILNIDADEVVSDELRQEIEAVLSSPEQKYDGFEISRVVFFLGKWWRKGGWYPEFRLRLCRKVKTSWGGDDPHEKAEVEGAVGRLKGELLHYTYNDLTDQIRSLNAHSLSAAKTLNKKKVNTSRLQILLRPISRFLKFYFAKKGYREGFSGFLVACNEAYYTFLKYAKLWEMQRK